MARAVHPATTYPAVVGAVLGQMRDRKGLSQQELAQLVRVSQPTWSRVERGAVGLTIEQLALAARSLGLAPGAILAEADRAVASIEGRGIRVGATRVERPLSDGQVLIAGAALGLLVAALINGSK